MKLPVIVIASALAALGSARAQVSVSAVNTVGYSQDFDSLALSPGTNATWTDNTTLSGWYFGVRTSSTTYGSTPGGLYYFRSLTPGQTVGANAGPQSTALSTAGSNRSLGLQPSTGSNSTALPMAIGLRLTNNTGVTIDSVLLSFVLEQWSQGYSSVSTHEQLAFSYSTTATGLSPLAGNTFTDASAFNFTSPVATQTTTSSTTYALDGNDAANRTDFTGTLTIDGGWAPGTDLWLRWYVPTSQASGSRGGIISLDDFAITANYTAPSSSVPEPSAFAAIAGLAVLGLAFLRRRR